jgi:hypothetical protein
MIILRLNVDDDNNEDIFNLNYINNSDHDKVCTDDEEKEGFSYNTNPSKANNNRNVEVT